MPFWPVNGAHGFEVSLAWDANTLYKPFKKSQYDYALIKFPAFSGGAIKNVVVDYVNLLSEGITFLGQYTDPHAIKAAIKRKFSNTAFFILKGSF